MVKLTEKEESALMSVFASEDASKAFLKAAYKATIDDVDDYDLGAVGGTSGWISSVDPSLPGDEFKVQVLARRHAIDTLATTCRELHAMANKSDKEVTDEEIE